MAQASSRALWKGAISFGLVHIPIALHSATSDSGVDFDWLDKRSMDPVGYKRINKKTGREVKKENIVRGVARADGNYVVLTDEEIAAAYPKATQTIDIEGFVEPERIPFVYLDRPYYVAPGDKGAKVYALLREALLRTGRVGLARVVIHNKQHLAALIPSGPGLVLNLLRWSEDIRSWNHLELPPEGAEAAGLSDKELRMATQLVEGMGGEWRPEAFHDAFKGQILELVERKAAAGQFRAVAQTAPAAEDFSAEVIDLTELLQRSLKQRPQSAPDALAPTAKKKRATARTSAETGRTAESPRRPRRKAA
ncbi:MAG: Ku protein [Xylophilus ampelinus]